MAFFLIFLFSGAYVIYWFAVTKQEINELGGDIPTAWLLIPGPWQFYFFYRYARAFCRNVAPQTEGLSNVWVMWLLYLLWIPGIIYTQVKLNRLATY